MTEKHIQANEDGAKHIRHHHLRKREAKLNVQMKEDKTAALVEEKPARRRKLPGSYWGYLTLLLLTLTLFIGFSIKVDDTTLSVELKKMDVEQYVQKPALIAETETAAESLPQENQPDNIVDTNNTPMVFADSVSSEVSTETKEKNYHYATTDTSGGERFLLIGDSMNEFLRIRLNDYCIKNGYTMDCVIWYGATTKQYGTCDTIAYFIRKYHPTYVLLTIGSNELFIRDIIAKRTDYVRHIVSQLGNIPFVWVGPPNWKNDTGINQLILQHVGASRYFESKKLSFNRCKDGAHPTKSSALNWLDHIAQFISTEANHTLVMENPDTNYNKIPHTTILKMVRE